MPRPFFKKGIEASEQRPESAPLAEVPSVDVPEQNLWRNGDTPFQGIVADALGKCGYRRNVPVVYDKAGSRHRLMFADESRKVNIEANGPSHLRPYRRRRDLARDRQLQELGWIIVRVQRHVNNHVEITSSAMHVDEDIANVIRQVGFAVAEMGWPATWLHSERCRSLQ